MRSRGGYNLLNHLLSAGIDRRWRARAIRSLQLTGCERVLDLCTGTGDLAIAAVRAQPPAARVVGVDFSGAMLRVGAGKLRSSGLDTRVSMVQVTPRGFRPATPRSTPSRSVSASETSSVSTPRPRSCIRVLKPNGRLAILEFAVPTIPVFRELYGWYVNRVLPRIGRALSRNDSAYAYLPASISAFASPDEFVKILRQAGFREISSHPSHAGQRHSLYGASGVGNGS